MLTSVEVVSPLFAALPVDTTNSGPCLVTQFDALTLQ